MVAALWCGHACGCGQLYSIQVAKAGEPHKAPGGDAAEGMHAGAPATRRRACMLGRQRRSHGHCFPAMRWSRRKVGHRYQTRCAASGGSGDSRMHATCWSGQLRSCAEWSVGGLCMS
eukprot:jgi/Ulvmu1/1464/UM011_0194.1